MLTGAGLGIFAKKPISHGVWLGEYEGTFSVIKRSAYLWSVRQNHTKMFVIDAKEVQFSNWLRWVNCAMTRHQMNLLVIQCKERIYYVTIRPIFPGEELFVYYGDVYGKSLGVNITLFENLPHLQDFLAPYL